MSGDTAYERVQSFETKLVIDDSHCIINKMNVRKSFTKMQVLTEDKFMNTFLGFIIEFLSCFAF